MVKEITQQEFDFLYVLSGKLRLTYINHDARRKSFFGKARKFMNNYSRVCRVDGTYSYLCRRDRLRNYRKCCLNCDFMVKNKQGIYNYYQQV